MPQATRRISRAVERVQRVLLLAASGLATVDALDWTATNGIPIIACDQRGHLRWVLVPGEGAQWKTGLRRAQAAALHEPAGIELARFLITTKLREQSKVLETAIASLGTRADLRFTTPRRTLESTSRTAIALPTSHVYGLSNHRAQVSTSLYGSAYARGSGRPRL